LPLATVGGYLLLCRRSVAIPYALVCIGWLGLFVAYSEANFGTLLPWYYLQRDFEASRIPIGLAGHLVSPSRGLFVFSPIIPFLVWLVLRNRSHLPMRPLVALAALTAGVHLVVASAWANWWGGNSYGPRLLTDIIPWLVLLAIAGLAAWREAGLKGWFTRAVCATLLIISVAIHARGAFSTDPYWWASQPFGLQEHPERVWDWRDPQFLRRR
jgi:hypothetical protein